MTDTADLADGQLAAEPGYRLTYIVAHQAWWANAARSATGSDPELYVHKESDGGGIAWEFTIVDRSRTIGRPSVQVRVFHESFAAFAELAPLFAALAAERPDTLGTVQAMLDRFGFTDVTQRREESSRCRVCGGHPPAGFACGTCGSSRDLMDRD